MKRLFLCAIALFLVATSVWAEEPQSSVTPEQVKVALEEIDSLIRERMEATGVPGVAIGVVHQGKVVAIRGYGVREVGHEEPVDGETVFQLASLSKPVGSTVVAALVADGAVSWDDPIVRYLPKFRLDTPEITRRVTIRDMYSHRSGLPEHAGDLLENLGFTRETILERLHNYSTANRFRSSYAYTNFGLTAGAVAAATAAGKSWEDLSRERLYGPLGMEATSSRHDDFVAAPNRVKGHIRENGTWVAKHDRQPDPQSPAGGASSSASDMTRWMLLHLNEGKHEDHQLIPASALAETYRPHAVSRPADNPAKERSAFYGLGWNVDYDDAGRVRLGHSGAFTVGASTAVQLVPSEELGIVVLTNAAPIGLSESIMMTFLDVATVGHRRQDWDTIFGEIFASLTAEPAPPVDYANPPESAEPPLPLESYVGTYRNSFVGDVQVTVEARNVVLLLGPTPMRLPLTHYQRDVFTFALDGEDARGLSAAAFSIGADGAAMALDLEVLGKFRHLTRKE